MTPYRNSDLLALARHAPCCMGCGKHNEGDVVPAHRNEGKAAGSKNPDYMWAALCTLKCHADLDQGSAMTREERRDFWNQAFWKTQDWLWREGWLTVCTMPAPHVEVDTKPKRRIATGRKIPPRPFEKGPKRSWPTRAFERKKPPRQE